MVAALLLRQHALADELQRLRCLRLLSPVGVIEEHAGGSGGVDGATFSLTAMGRALAPAEDGHESGMASMVLHFLERPLWDAWLELPSHIRGDDDGAGNRKFDAKLWENSVEWGLRDVNDLNRLAAYAGLEPKKRLAMPANNLLLQFVKVRTGPLGRLAECFM